jgi:hypothetical protein
MASCHEPHRAAAANLHCRVRGGAPSRFQLAITNASKKKFHVVAFEGDQCAGDSLLGHTFGIALDRVFEEPGVRSFEIGHALVQGIFAAQRRCLGGHSKVRIGERLPEPFVTHIPARIAEGIQRIELSFDLLKCGAAHVIPALMDFYNIIEAPCIKQSKSLLEFAATVRRDQRDLKPRDMIDLQSFIWVQGSKEYD